MKKNKTFKSSLRVSLSAIASAIIVAFAPYEVQATPVSTTIGGSGSISTPVIHKGDTINIEATLSTTDPNENGEGEPLTVQSSSGFSFTISEYSQPRAFSYTAAADNESLSGFISGYEGDESASITVDVNQKKRFTQDQKNSFAKASARLNTDAGYLATAAALCLAIPDPSVTKVCAVALGVGSGATWALSGELNELALDPADPNFTQIAVPVTPPFTGLSVGPGITQNEVDSVNAFISNQTQAIGLARAMITSINRAQGAFEAGNTSWENKQMNAASQYAVQLSALLDAQAALQANVKSALTGVGFPSITVTPNDVFSFEANVLNNGLPSSIVQVLTQLGSTNSEIEQIRQIAFVQDINAAAGNFPANYTNSALNTDIGSAAKALIDFSLANATPLVKGQHVGGHGFISMSTGDHVDIDFNAVGAIDNQGNPSLVGTNFHLFDHASGFDIEQGQISRAAILNNLVVVDGTYLASDNSTGTFRAVAVDNSKKGQGQDTISISLSNGYKVSGTLTGGQVLIQK